MVSKLWTAAPSSVLATISIVRPIISVHTWGDVAILAADGHEQLDRSTPKLGQATQQPVAARAGRRAHYERGRYAFSPSLASSS